MTEHIMTFPMRAWALIENRAESVDLEGTSYISSAIKLGSLIVDRYWQNLEYGEDTVICLHEESTDTTHAVYQIEDDWSKAPNNSQNSRLKIDQTEYEDSAATNTIDADEFVESEILLSEAMPLTVQIPLNGDDLERTIFYATTLNMRMVDYVSWCIRMRCHYDISTINGYAMIVNDATNNTVTQIHLI